MALCQPLISPTLRGCGWPPSHWCRVVTASSVFLVASVCHAFYLGWVGNSLTGVVKVVCVFIPCLFGTGGRNVTAFHWCMQSNLSDLPGTARVIFDRFHLKEQERLGRGGGPILSFYSCHWGISTTNTKMISALSRNWRLSLAPAPLPSSTCGRTCKPTFLTCANGPIELWLKFSWSGSMVFLTSTIYAGKTGKGKWVGNLRTFICNLRNLSLKNYHEKRERCC